MDDNNGLNMSNNREERIYRDSVHIYLALQREPKQGNKKCMRTVIKDDELDLEILTAKLKVFGGEWRIHKTVNARMIEPARKWLLKHLIDNPENAAFIDSCWRTALLQKQCKETKYFMLDIDTQDEDKIKNLENLIPNNITLEGEGGLSIPCHYPVKNRIKSPKGWHFITEPFDTREICKLEYVTLLRDGYYYVKTVKEGE